MAADGFDRSIADVAHLAERLALGHLGDVHLHRRYADALRRVRYRDRGVRICGRIKNDAVNAVKIRLLYRVNEVTLVV